MNFPQIVERTSGFEPLYLFLVVGMVYLNHIHRLVGMDNFHGQGFAGRKFIEVNKVEDVIFLDFVVVIFIGKGYGEHALFFQVCFMDAGKGFHNDSYHTQMTRFHGGMLT